MKNIIGVVIALLLMRVREGQTNNGNCFDNYCVAVYIDKVDFDSAQKSCFKKGGYLMNVRKTVADYAMSDLLAGLRGHFWIGLKCIEGCTDSSLNVNVPGGITGNKTTNKNGDKTSCCRRCLTLSKDAAERTESLCNTTADGYLCAFNNTNKCGQLTFESPVVYETPFDFSSKDLIEVPHSSNATRLDLGTKYVCLDGKWLRAPWNCEVYQGGCEHNCNKRNNTYICTCLPGYKLASDSVSCFKSLDDTCLQAGCSQDCLAEVDNYICNCHSGFKHKDGEACKHVRDCRDERLCLGEHSHCVISASGFECQCVNGFKKEKDTCEDEDECESAPCEQECNNTVGSYYCECGDGYKVSAEDRHKCVLDCPQQECPAVACDPNSPFQCDCPSGFILEERPTGYYCVDIDECGMFYCDQNCENTAGGYICSCNKGFSLTGSSYCVAIGEMGTTTPFDIFTPTSRPPKEPFLVISPGGLLGISIFVVIGILLIVCLVHHIIKHHVNHHFSVDKYHSEDKLSLQHVVAEKYTKDCQSQLL